MPKDLTPEQQLDQIEAWKQESKSFLDIYYEQWADNTDLIKGRFSEGEVTKSRVRKRSKIFFRKIWASCWRILASFYNAFLRDRDVFKVEGRDTVNDPKKAKVLQFMMEYHRDKMMNNQSLFKKFIFAFQDIMYNGWAVAKLTWEFDPVTGKDGPKYVQYPIEQVFPDMKASTRDERRYMIFENYMTKDELKAMKYDNIDKAQPEDIPSNIVRSSRFEGQTDPLQEFTDKAYPKPGTAIGADQKEGHVKVYIVHEVFYKDEGEMYFTVVNPTHTVLKKPEKSPYGNRIPDVLGDCLIEAHKLIGEGFPEPLEGPQESYNANLNMRKDDVALNLSKMKLVNRFANVDLQSLVNSRPGGLVMTDDVDRSVREIDHTEVTQSSYIEAQQDSQMMDEMSGVTPGKLGLGSEQKATVAQINLSESNAKIDLYIAIVAETFVRDFFTQLAHLIQRFETNEAVFKIANDQFRETIEDPIEQLLSPDVQDIDDFEADIIVNVGIGTVGRDVEVRNTFLAMDRAIMSNQSAIQLLSSGIQTPNITLFDTTQFMLDILPKLGHKDVNKYKIQIPAQQGQGGQNPDLTGRTTPQIGANDINADAGGFGGLQ